MTTPEDTPGLALPPLLDEIRPVLVARDTPVYLVGGAVRDALLGQASHDLDFVVPEKAIQLAFTVADALNVPAYILDRERDTGRVVLPDLETMIDFARFRAPDLEGDLCDRDFTINAMALPASAISATAIIDPTGGRQDLAAGLIRLTHAASLADDPVRALRALRLAARLHFKLTPDTETAVAAAAPLLNQVSPERVRDELLKLLLTGAPGTGLAQMAALELLPVILPEIAALAGVTQSSPHHEPVLAHTISVLRWLAQVETAVVYQEETVTPALAQAQSLWPPMQPRWPRIFPGRLTVGCTAGLCSAWAPCSMMRARLRPGQKRSSRPASYESVFLATIRPVPGLPGAGCAAFASVTLPLKRSGALCAGICAHARRAGPGRRLGTATGGGSPSLPTLF